MLYIYIHIAAACRLVIIFVSQINLFHISYIECSTHCPEGISELYVVTGTADI